MGFADPTIRSPRYVMNRMAQNFRAIHPWTGPGELRGSQRAHRVRVAPTDRSLRLALPAVYRSEMVDVEFPSPGVPGVGGRDRSKLLIVIPALNEEDSIASIIERCLSRRHRRSLRDRPRAIEVTVVSDGSTDQTVEIASRYLDGST
jgi:hypothetical protein